MRKVEQDHEISALLKSRLDAPLAADVLIVDDTLENIVLLAEILETHGYHARKAVNGKMAKAAIEATLPDLILLDICMPEIDGYTLCKTLKANSATADIPVIFLSALSDDFDKVKAFDVGGVEYITKPFQIGRLDRPTGEARL